MAGSASVCKGAVADEDRRIHISNDGPGKASPDTWKILVFKLWAMGTFSWGCHSQNFILEQLLRQAYGERIKGGPVLEAGRPVIKLSQ